MKFNFGGRLKREFPSQVMVDITEVCNLACVHCTHPKFKKSHIYEKAMLDPELNKKMVHEVASYGLNKTLYIRYTSNGEPLVHPKSYEMIYYAVKNSKTKVTLTTNGTILDDTRIKKIMDTGLHMIDVSIDAYENDTYKKIRVNGNLEVTKGNVLKLVKFKNQIKAKTKIIVSFVEQNENRSEVEEFRIFWKKSGVDQVLIRSLHTNSGSNAENNFHDNSFNKEKKRRACLYPWERIILTAKGMLSFCPTDWYGKSIVNDYRTSTIKDTWSNLFYSDLRKQHKTCNFKNNFCKECPDWANTSWPEDENKSYADLVENLLYKNFNDTIKV
jgi:molybdenum cofactor biosynthesis enzyme MoaA